MTGTVPPNDPSGGWQQPGFYLNQMAPPPPPPKRWPGWVIAAIAIGALGILGAMGAILANIDTEPAAKPSPGIGSPAPYDALPGQTVPTSGAKDTFGAKACAAVRASNNGPSPFSQEPAAMAAIAVDGKNSSNPFIRASSEKLAQAARAAVDAKGADPMSGIKMGTAALNLETTCIEQWYYPPAK